MSQFLQSSSGGGAGSILTLTGNSGGAVSPTAGNINVLGGTGINIVGNPGTSTLTVNAIGGGVTWTVITANQTAAVNNGYFCNKAGTLTLALPLASAVGDVIEVININTATGTQFTQAANQQIFFATASTTLGATGTLTSSALGDSLKLVCRTANLVWYVSSAVGNWTPA